MFPLFGIIHRMIFWEIVRVFGLALAGLTGLFLVAGLVQQAAQLGLSPGQVVGVIPLLIPSSLPYTIPATTLFAACVVYGRVSGDNEAVALKAAGVDLRTALRPAVALGGLTAAAAGWLSLDVIPRTQTRLQERVLRDPEEMLYNLLKRERRYCPPNFPYAIFVRDVQGRRLVDVVLKRRAQLTGADGRPLYLGYDVIARAREARLVVDLAHGKLSIDPDRWVVTGPNAHLISEGNKPVEVDLPDALTATAAKARPMALEWAELPARLADLAAEAAAIAARREANRRAADAARDPDQRAKLAAQDPHYAAQLADVDRRARAVRFEQVMRPALAAGCLCFALVGCPVGLWAHRSDYLSTFVTCFLPAVFVYYPVLLAGGGLARDGKVPMWAGVWAADAVGFVAAGLLAWRLIRR